MIGFLKTFGKKKIEKESEDYNKNIIVLGNELISSSSMLFDKKLSGDIYCLDEVVIDSDGYLTGKITTNKCVVKGRVNGSIFSLKNMIIKRTAIIEGEIMAGTVEVESGAVINGCITLQRGLQAPELIKKVKSSYSDTNRKECTVSKETESPAAGTNEELLQNPASAALEKGGNNSFVKKTTSEINTSVYNNSSESWW